jgi:23S rRNA U2552 (ribose-2'-O)-methylase RlmE/FtsJ
MDTIDDTMSKINANLALQVNRSHLERMSDFLMCHCRHDHDGGDGCDVNNENDIRILATKKSTASKSCSLIFLHAVNGLAFITHMTKHHEFVLLGLNKVYAIQGEGTIIRGRFASTLASIDGACDDERIDQYLFDKLMGLRTQQQRARRSNAHSNPTNHRSVVVKVDVFPSKLQHRVISILTKLLDDDSIPEAELDISPTNYTHTLSIVQMDDAEESKTKTIHTFLVGIAPADQSARLIIYPHYLSSNDICRAYHKLSEVFERYRHQTNNPSFPFSTTMIELVGSKRKQTATTPRLAVDCGSAPGGWTKYLIEQTACDEVYAIDPGDMDASLLAIPNVHHMKMTAATAIPHLHEILAKKDTKIALWVSDMCVHDIPQQVDVFKSAYDEGIFEKNAAFVLTIKCNKGHGRERFDMLVEEEAIRLRKMGAYRMMTFHLFSNRIGERTIAGFID